MAAVTVAAVEVVEVGKASEGVVEAVEVAASVVIDPRIVGK